ncbi:hypothetical protein BsWGS_23771 [Bradybaena similaris]
MKEPTVVLILAVTVLAAANGCLLGWIRHGKYCYAFDNAYLTYYEAAAMCKIYGGRLPQIDSQSKQDFIAAEMANKSFTKAWAGGTSRFHIGIWEWIPSHKLFNYSNWAVGEPFEPAGRRCMVLNSNLRYKWASAFCAYREKFLCERRHHPTTASTTTTSQILH